MTLKYPRKGRSSLTVGMSSPWLCSLARERVKGDLTTHFLKRRLDVGVDEGDRIISVLVVRGQIMEHVKQLRASRGTIL